ncbi:hypothetical protein V7O62_00410 [Methanolobus sp. ZRKC2]|uniref:hypothetical protein n=1 Tax=Methanolobus sp. ZRKC2 TaxID=3125783 RepID=UPI0032491C58
MSKEKMEAIREQQKHLAVLHRNKKLLKINVIILSVGLALSFIGRESIGEPVLWLGIIIFVYTFITNYNARSALKKLKGPISK